MLATCRLPVAFRAAPAFIGATFLLLAVAVAPAFAQNAPDVMGQTHAVASKTPLPSGVTWKWSGPSPRADWIDPTPANAVNDVVVWQWPLPGQTIGTLTELHALCTENVRVPSFVNMQVVAAKELAGERGIQLFDGSTGRPIPDSSSSMMISDQITAKGSVVAPGDSVGVVLITPSPGLPCLLEMAAAAAVALVVGFAASFRIAKAKAGHVTPGPSAPHS